MRRGLTVPPLCRVRACPTCVRSLDVEDAVERCEGCGFVWADVARDAITPRTGAGAEAIARLLRDQPDLSRRRATPGRWSALEYGAHVRDVLLVMRDRLVVGLVEDEPSFKPMYRDERVDRGLYRDDSVDGVAGELVVAAELFGRLFTAVDPAALHRVVLYAYPAPTKRSLLWLGRQTLHEVEHHRGDAEESLRLVGGT